MSARVMRRSFATPFVVTVACGPATPAPQAPAPEPTPITAVANPPRPTPVPDNARWTLLRDDSGCKVVAHIECPPKVACNPPPPRPYACPDGVATGATTITAYGGECMIEPEPMKCPPNATCNPPPPRVVPCPE